MKGFVVLAAVLLAGCSPGAGGDCKPGETCLRAGLLSEPGSLDPARAFVKQDQTLILDLLTGLTSFDARGRIVPGLAERWSASGDQLTWTFKLRSASWSDGVPITAEDVRFSIRRLIDPKTAASYASLVYPIVNAERIHAGAAPLDSLGIDAPDPRTLIIRLDHPVPYFPALLAHYGLVPVPPHVVRRWGDGWTVPGRFVSSGAYLLGEWRLGDRITLKRNPRFYDAGKVCLDRVDYFPSPDVTRAERRVRRGELDWHAKYDAARHNFLRRDAVMRDYVRASPFVDIVYLAFNLQDPLLADVRVRRALSMALDRDFIARRLLGAAGHRPADSFVPPGLGALPAEPPWARLDLARRQAIARGLLGEAGYTSRRPLTIEIKSSIGSGVPSAIAADFRAIGVRVRQARGDVAVFFNDLQLGDFQVAYTDWIADYPDATNFLNLLRNGNPANYGRYRNPAYDALVSRAERDADPRARALHLQAAELRLLTDAAVAPVFVNASNNLVNPRVTGWHENLDDVHLSRFLCFKDQAPRTQ